MVVEIHRRIAVRHGERDRIAGRERFADTGRDQRRMFVAHEGEKSRFRRAAPDDRNAAVSRQGFITGVGAEPRRRPSKPVFIILRWSHGVRKGTRTTMSRTRRKTVSSMSVVVGERESLVPQRGGQPLDTPAHRDARGVRVRLRFAGG